MILILILSLIGVQGSVVIMMLMLWLSPPLPVARLLAAALEGGRAHAVALDFDSHVHFVILQTELLFGG